MGNCIEHITNKTVITIKNQLPARCESSSSRLPGNVLCDQVEIVERRVVKLGILHLLQCWPASRLKICRICPIFYEILLKMLYCSVDVLYRRIFTYSVLFYNLFKYSTYTGKLRPLVTKEILPGQDYLPARLLNSIKMLLIKSRLALY